MSVNHCYEAVLFCPSKPIFGEVDYVYLLSDGSSPLPWASIKVELSCSAQGLQCRLSNRHCIPLVKEGLKVLGCPIGSPAFCSATVGQIVADIQNDLLLLQDFQALHQRMKLATYCCNTRSSYLLRAMSPGSMEQYTRLLDKSFDDFTAHTLCFEQDYQDCQHKEYYQSALAQYRLGIKQGGMGMTSLELVAPVAYFVALREFHQWFLQYYVTGQRGYQRMLFMVWFG